MPPAKSSRQQHFMALCSHNRSKSKGKCPPKKVAEEFSHKPKGGYRKRNRTVPRPVHGYY